MEQIENNKILQNGEIKENLLQIKKYLETDIYKLRREIDEKHGEIEVLKDELDNVQHSIEGNRQLINKLLGEVSKLQNDIEWYKKTYEKRSFLGVIREKLFRQSRK